MKDGVVVLMSTYNGEKYLAEQIDSILGQKGVLVQLIVRDDGSSDRTISILEQYEKEGKLKLTKGKNVGVGSSFMQMLYDAPAGLYYAFADQDDVWMENKLSEAVKILKEQEKPCLYASDTLLVDENLNEIGLRFEKKVMPYDLLSTIFNTAFCGCTLVMNECLRKILVDSRYRPSERVFEHRCHDTWTILAANIVGKIYYDPRSFIKYRQHANNTIGVVKDPGLLDKLKLRFQHLANQHYKRSRSRLALELYKKFGKVMKSSDRKYLKILIKTNTLKGKIRFLRCEKFRKISGDCLPVLAVKVFIGWI